MKLTKFQKSSPQFYMEEGLFDVIRVGLAHFKLSNDEEFVKQSLERYLER